MDGKPCFSKAQASSAQASSAQDSGAQDSGAQDSGAQNSGGALHEFAQVGITTLAECNAETLDTLPYGVIGLSRDGLAQVYNATESRAAGLPPERVLGRNFFDNIAQCMNNFMVAQRFLDEPELDATIDFVLTLRMRPTPVRLRLLQSEAAPLRYILIARR